MNIEIGAQGEKGKIWLATVTRLNPLVEHSTTLSFAASRSAKIFEIGPRARARSLPLSSDAIVGSDAVGCLKRQQPPCIFGILVNMRHVPTHRRRRWDDEIAASHVIDKGIRFQLYPFSGWVN